MLKIQLFSYLKRNWLLIFILSVFFLKQLFFVAVFPIFQGPDETAHYTTIQHYAESKEERELSKNIISPSIKKGFDYSEEIYNTKKLSEADKISFNSNITQSFSDSDNGAFEIEIKNNTWKRYIEDKKPSVVKGVPGYYLIPSFIEKILSEKDIFFRFFTERIFSIILGLFIIFFTYLLAIKIGWDKKIAFLFTTLIAFQPMFSQASAIINYDIMLIFSFTLFIYGATSSLKNKLDWKNASIMLSATILGLLTKAPAIVLGVTFFILMIYFSKKYFRIKTAYFISGAIVITLVSFIIIENIAPENYFNMIFFIKHGEEFNSLYQSVVNYIGTTENRWDWSELSYWGNFGWLDAKIPYWIVNIVHFIEISSVIGILAYFVFPKKIPEFLPEKRLVIFFIGIFLALQIAIRFADWHYFNNAGKIEIGTHGRYFLPVITTQFILIAIGLGMLSRKYFIWKNTLKILALGMIMLWLYSIFIIIIPRYYL